MFNSRSQTTPGCKRWHGLIINDPNIWNCISIVSPDLWDILSWSRSTRPYLSLCVERGHTSLLNTELNFTTLKPARQRLAKRFHSGFFHSPSVSKGMRMRNSLTNGWKTLTTMGWKASHFKRVPIVYLSMPLAY